MYKIIAAATIGIVIVSGCATFSPDGGFDAVQSVAKDRLNKELKWIKSEAGAVEVRSSVRKLLAQTLGPDDAVQIALLNNRGLQAIYAELGIAEADLVQAGRFPNPRLSYLRTRHDDEYKIESVFTFNLFALITVPLAQGIEKQRFEETKLRVAADVLRVAADTRRAYYQAVAAHEAVKYMQQVKVAAGASAELAARMAGAGNFSRLQQAREQAFYAEVAAQLARVSQAAVTGRELLTRHMGLWGEEVRFALPERLPDLPNSAEDPGDIEAKAMRQRLDLQAVKLEIESLASSLGLTRRTRFINVLEFGTARTTETPEPRKRGYEIEFQLPLFDWGSAKVAKAETIYMQSVHRAAESAINARSEVREAYLGYRTAYDIARHYRDEIVPLRKKISDEMLLRYNGMLASVYELLADAREQVASVNAASEALRDFWVADAELKLALTGRSPGPIGGRIRMPALTPAAGGVPGH